MIENPYVASRCSSAASQTARAAGEEVVKVRAHARLLRTLPGEDVDGRTLSDLSSSVDYLFAALVHGLDFDHHIAITHAGMGELDAQLVTGEDHNRQMQCRICQPENVIWAVTLKQSTEEKPTR